MVWAPQWPRERDLHWIPLLKSPNSLMTVYKLLNFLVHCLFIILRHFCHPELWRFNKMKLITTKHFILMCPYGGTLGCFPHLSHRVRWRPICLVSVGEASKFSPFLSLSWSQTCFSSCRLRILWASLPNLKNISVSPLAADPKPQSLINFLSNKPDICIPPESYVCLSVGLMSFN